MKESFNVKKKQLKSLIKTIVSFDNTKDCQDFLLDLCTPAELQALCDRWEVAQLITKGENYRDIAEKTQCSTATITRVGRSLKYGQGGYKLAFEKIGHGVSK